jgi:uncharacterized protein (DUF2147 family)
VASAALGGLALLLLTCRLDAAAQTPPHSNTQGDWFTEDHRGVVHVGPCGAVLCGTVVGVSDFRADGSAITDVHGRSQCDLAIIRGMVPGDDNRLHGTVTDPTDGKTYSAELWVGEDGALRLRGFIGLELFGSTQRWEKFSGHLRPDCHFTSG